MKVHITIDDMDHFDETVELAKEAIRDGGGKMAGEIILMEPQIDMLPHGGAEFDGSTFTEHRLGSWRIGKVVQA